MSPNVTALLIIILVPVVPSYLLFRLLPEKAVVTGPFKGLRIDLSGAFAGYFLIFLVLIGVRGSFQSTTYQEWVVTGQIVLPDDPASIYIDPRYVTLSVPSMRSDWDGNFTMDFVTTSDGQFDFPHLYINYPGYQAETFWLGPKDRNVRNERLPVLFDSAHSRIDLGAIQLIKAASPETPAGSTTKPNPYGG
jgi:hypothetical protein